MESFEGSPHMVSDDGSVADQSAISQWGKFFEEGGRTLGRTFMVVDQGIQRKAMEEAGFVDIQEWEFKVSRSSILKGQRFGRLIRTRGLANTNPRPLSAAGPETRN